MKTEESLFKGLGDSTRLRIMAILIDGDEYCVCDIMEALSLPQSTVSRHLAYLKNSGWLDDRRENRWNYYRIKSRIGKLETDIINALQTALPRNAEVKKDRKKLNNYLNKKNSDACS